MHNGGNSCFSSSHLERHTIVSSCHYQNSLYGHNNQAGVAVRIPSFPRSRERVRELSELAGEIDLGNALGSRLMVPNSNRQ